ncbi:hypothetical protein CRENBAI_023986 [Crenichthys baileyi]|uniref:Uncharacterized protein n=1 Tax=Crenichthys baileyi TaxID=28760 RepID=A0AAV9RW76_9TELE
MCHNLSEKIFLKQGISKDIAQSQEGWSKRDGDKPCTGSSSYFSTLSTVPVPKRGKSAKKTGKGQKTKDRKSSSNTATSDGTKPTMEVEYLWTVKPSEVVVAVVKNDEQRHKVTLRHREFQSLRPHELLMGKVIESYITVILNAKGIAGRLYQLNHYTMGAILYGTREQVVRQGLKRYFKMRRNRLGKEDRVNIKWQPGTITHTFQKDGTSCGVFVMEEEIPQVANMQSSANLVQ